MVVDEHGGTAGIVTMSDIMEQIIGRLDDEYDHDDEDEVVTMDDGSYLLDGSVPIDEVVELLGFEPEETEDCETAGGLLLVLFDRIPDEGESVTIEHDDRKATFTVVDMDRHRVEKARVVLEQKPEAEGSENNPLNPHARESLGVLPEHLLQVAVGEAERRERVVLARRVPHGEVGAEHHAVGAPQAHELARAPIAQEG